MPEKRRVTASAPGSLMLAGEHAVLRGELALVCAIEKRLSVAIAAASSGMVRMRSQLGAWTLPAADLPQAVPPGAFRFLAAALAPHADAFRDGIEVTVESGMPADWGLGTSAAVAVAATAAAGAYAGEPLPPQEVFRRARETILRVQGGRGSGADAAASALGGIVALRVKPDGTAEAERLPAEGVPEMTLLYAGYKTPTPEVISWVKARFARHPALLRAVDRAAGRAAEEAKDAAGNRDWSAFAEALSNGRRAQKAYGVEDRRMRELLEMLDNAPGTLAAKISGSGLGDCVLGLGTAPAAFPCPALRLAVSQNGVHVSGKIPSG
ncbi:MAG: GHMP kinase [Kiritimatiellae bacterium]|nr:GHMP kinase [Kiritimatiellia bacterium]